MTNFFNRLFGRNNKSVETDINPTLATSNINPKPADQGNMRPQVKNSVTYTYPADIRQFLDRDYFIIGFDAAMQYPHAENKQYLHRTISAEYRLILQDVAQRMDAQIAEQERLNIRTQGISAILEKEIQSRILQLNSLKQSLEGQLILSIDNEGWIAPSLARFELGFLNGILQYHQKNDLLGGINTLLITKDKQQEPANENLSPLKP